MATKYYGINDKWTDDEIENVIEVTSEDGSVDSVKVNGVEYGGGGGGDLSTAPLTITWVGSEEESSLVKSNTYIGDYTEITTEILIDAATSPVTEPIILYHNAAGIYLNVGEITTMSGNITYDADTGEYIMTGPASISVKDSDGGPEE